MGRDGIQRYHPNHTVLPGTQLNKQHFTAAKVSVGQSWKANGSRRPTWGELVGLVDVGAK